MGRLLTLIGAIVVLIVIATVVYFAWVGWKETGEPVPEVGIERDVDAPAEPVVEPPAAEPVPVTPAP